MTDIRKLAKRLALMHQGEHINYVRLQERIERILREDSAPDPHEFSGNDYVEGCIEQVGESESCGRPADDPIHEVSDGTNEQGDSRRLGGGEEGHPVQAQERDQAGAPTQSGDGLDSRRDNPADPLQTEPVTVGPGDEVRWNSNSYTAIGDHEGCLVIAWTDELGIKKASVMQHATVYTPDGRPVSGFDPDAGKSLFQRKGGQEMYDVCSKLDDAEERIAELERKLKKERKTHKQVCRKYEETIRNVKRQREETSLHMFMTKDELARLGWVRLDDETIERVAKQYDQWTNEDWDCFTEGTLRRFLRDLRDGRLEGGGDGDET
jgi:hypothetical protein